MIRIIRTRTLAALRQELAETEEAATLYAAEATQHAERADQLKAELAAESQAARRALQDAASAQAALVEAQRALTAERRLFVAIRNGRPVHVRSRQADAQHAANPTGTWVTVGPEEADPGRWVVWPVTLPAEGGEGQR